MNTNENNTASVFQPGQTIVFTTESAAFKHLNGLEVKVGPRGIFFDNVDRRYVDVVWPAGSGRCNGGYHPHEFSAKPVKAVEPTAPMTKAVLDLLRSKGAITQMEAIGVLRCRALPRRIADLKELGHKIVREFKVDPTGQRYARYHLQQEAA